MEWGLRAGRILALVLLLLAVLAGSTCDDPTSVQLDITGISDFAPDAAQHSHFHRCTIPGRDITVAAPGDHVYTSTTDNGHSHEVVLTGTQLQDLQQKYAVVNVTSRPAQNPPHTHVFQFQH